MDGWVRGLGRWMGGLEGWVGGWVRTRGLGE